MRFLAKQPIMTANRKTVGYELLFRASWENRFSGDGDAASRSILDWAMTHGFKTLVGDARPFVNCTRSIFDDGSVALLPRETVLEILETITPDDNFYRECQHMRRAGFELALDDYDFHEHWDPYLELVQYIKIDITQTTPEQRTSLIRKMRGRKTRFLAERIEDENDLKMAAAEGFHLYQGYFFMKPVMTARRSPGKSVHHLQLLGEVSKPHLDMDHLLRLLRSEPALCYRLLRYINAASMGMRQTVTDLRRALILIGEEPARQIIRTALAAEITGGGNKEVLERCVERARFCELLAPDLKEHGEELYLMGMLSAVLPLLELDPSDISAHLPLRPEILAALANPESQEEHALALSVALACERGDWNRLSESCLRLGLAEDAIALKRQAASSWTSQMVQNV